MQPLEQTSTDGPHRLGRYLLHTRLARGGMAEVWLARQEGPAGFVKQLVVKKILSHLASDKAFIQMFFNEAKLAALLNHPNVVQIFDFGEDRAGYFLVMEHIAGKNLRAVQQRCRQLGLEVPYGFIAHALYGVCQGLHYAHELQGPDGKSMNLIHRDISPDNILVSYDGQPKIVDFGIAKAAVSDPSTGTGMVKGKYAYMSPEQALGEPLDRRADVYSLGVCLHEMIAGAPPFKGTSDLSLLREIVQRDPPPLESLRSNVPPELVAICTRAMSKDRNARYPDALSLGRDLERYLHDHEPMGLSDVAAFMERLFLEEQKGTPSAPFEMPFLETTRSHDEPTDQITLSYRGLKKNQDVTTVARREQRRKRHLRRRILAVVVLAAGILAGGILTKACL